MPTYTDFLNLKKATLGAGELWSVQGLLNDNWDKVDAYTEKVDAMFVNAEKFGIDRTGATDTTAAMVAALDSLAGQPGTVIFPPGTYLVTDNLPFCTGQRIIAPPGTSINFQPTSAKSCFVSANWTGGVKYTDVNNPGRIGIANAEITGFTLRGKNAYCKSAVELTGARYCKINVRTGELWESDILINSLPSITGRTTGLGTYSNFVSGLIMATSTTANVEFKDDSGEYRCAQNHVLCADIRSGAIGVKIGEKCRGNRVAYCLIENHATAGVEINGNYCSVNGCWLENTAPANGIGVHVKSASDRSALYFNNIYANFSTTILNEGSNTTILEPMENALSRISSPLNLKQYVLMNEYLKMVARGTATAISPQEISNSIRFAGSLWNGASADEKIIVEKLMFNASNKYYLAFNFGDAEDNKAKIDEDGNIECVGDIASAGGYKQTVNYWYNDVISSLVIDDCEDAWDESVGANVTSTADNTDKQVGSYSAKIDVADAAAVGILATEAIVSASFVGYTHASFWIKSSVALDAGDLQLLLDDTASCASPLETLNVPALAADTWTRVSIALSNPAALTAVISVGLKMTVDKGAFIVRLDDVHAVKPRTDQIINCHGGTATQLTYVAFSGSIRAITVGLTGSITAGSLTIKIFAGTSELASMVMSSGNKAVLLFAKDATATVFSANTYLQLKITTSADFSPVTADMIATLGFEY